MAMKVKVSVLIITTSAVFKFITLHFYYTIKI